MFQIGNIQIRPTPELYERLKSGELVFRPSATATFSLLLSELRDPTVGFTLSSNPIANTFTLQDSLLRSAVVDVDSVSVGPARISYGMVAGVLMTVLKDVATRSFSSRATYNLTASALNTVLKDVKSTTIPTRSTYSLVSSSLI